MIKTILFLLTMMVSITAQAMPDFSLSQGSGAGEVVVEPNTPQSPFFLTEVWRLKSNGTWEKVGTTYQAYDYTDIVGQSGTYTYRTRWYNPSTSNPYNQYSGFGPSRSITVSISGAPTTAPNLSMPSSETNDGVFTVSWNAVGGATAYLLQRRAGSGNWLSAYSGSLRTVSQTLANGQYSYRVRGRNSAGNGPWSSIRSINVNVTNVSPPPPPASTFSPTSGVVVWSSVSGATSYQLRVGSNIVYSGPNTGHYLGSQVTSWSVRACNGGGCSAWKYGSN